ncbi:MAG TPA: hypothetical protein VGH93_09175 [Solirubrobacteraceae bacterium]
MTESTTTERVAPTDGVVGRMMVTPEPAGGTHHPTHPAVISAQLS